MQDHLRLVFVDRKGLDVLLDLLTDRNATPKAQREAASALFTLAEKVRHVDLLGCRKHAMCSDDILMPCLVPLYFMQALPLTPSYTK